MASSFCPDCDSMPRRIRPDRAEANGTIQVRRRGNVEPNPVMKLLRAALLASLPLMSSCALLVGTPEPDGQAGDPQALRALEQTEQQQVLQAARSRLETVQQQLDAGQFSEADATLAPLANSSLYPAEVAELKAKIGAGRERGASNATLRQVAIARRLALKDQFKEAQAILDSLDPNGVGKDEIRDVRELLNQRRLDESATAARKQVLAIRSLIKRGEFATAETLLDGIASGGAVPEEVAALKLELQTAKRNHTLSVEQQATTDQALGEVGERLVLPKTYGRTVIITPSLDPLEMPVGSMEDLINKRVTIQLDNAGVKELVQVLSQVDGLNIIADDALEAEKNLSMSLKDVPLKEVLSYIARNMGVAFHVGDNIIWVTESTEEPGSGPKLETRIIQLRHGFVPTLKAQGGGNEGDGGAPGGGEDDTDLEDSLDAFLADSPEGASYRVFKTRNVLIVRDTRENLRLVEELVKAFDKSPLQVLIEARFITISQDDLRDVGTELSTAAVTPLAVGDANTQLQVGELLTSLGALTKTNETGVGYAAFDGVIGDRAYNVVISALEKRSSTKNLSAPRITVLNNHSARIRRGNTTLYYSELETVAGGDSQVEDNDGAIVVVDAGSQTAFTGDPEELETGVTLDVKVNVGNNGQTVLLGLMPEIIELTRWRQFNVVAGGDTSSNNNDTDTNESVPGAVELPETSESSLQTAVSIRSGETVTLGGLVTSTVQKTVSKVPILGDIPILGFFFRHTSEKNVPQHLIIFVTATVIGEDGNFVQVAE